jgi:hypothetical protein
MPTNEEGEWLWEEDALDASSPVIEGDKVGRRLNRGWVEKVKGLLEELKSLFSWASYEDMETKESESVTWLKEQFSLGTGFRVFATKVGSRWLSFSSNAFKDREGEIFTTKSLEEAVKEADQLGGHGPLRLYHVPGADVGTCDFQGVVGRFLVESGTFDNTPVGEKAEEFFLQNTDEKFGVSIGFKFRKGDEADKVYEWLQIFERSVCPTEAAANRWTQFLPTGGKTLPLDNKKKDFLTQVLGKDLAEEVIMGAEDETKALEGSVAFKEEGEKTKEEEEEKAKPPPEEYYPIPKKKAGDLLEAIGTLKMLVGKVADEGLKKQLADALGKASDAIKGAEGYGYPQPGKKEEEVSSSDEKTSEEEAEKPSEEEAKKSDDGTGSEEALVQLVAEAVKLANAPLVEAISNVQSQVAGLSEGQEGLKSRIETLSQEQEGQKTTLIGLQKSDDEKIANAFKAKAGPIGSPASGSPDNVLDGEKADPLKSALEGEGDEKKSPAAPYIDDLFATVGGRRNE